MTRSADLLKLIDSGVSPKIAFDAIGIAESSLSEQTLKILQIRHARAKSDIMKALYQSTQKASANPSAIVSAAQAWLKMSEETQTQTQSISIEIEGEK